MYRQIVSPLLGEAIIREEGRKQAQMEGEAGIEVADDLQGGEVLLVGVGAVERRACICGQ